MATRYSDKTKKEVVDFVKKYDAENGRGGQSAAKKKYKINPISIKKWCVDQGYATGPGKKKKKPAAAAKPKAKVKAKATAKPATKKKTTRRRGRKPAAAAAKAAVPATPKSNASMTAKLKKMSDLSEKIDALQAQFNELKKSL